MTPTPKSQTSTAPNSKTLQVTFSPDTGAVIRERKALPAGIPTASKLSPWKSPQPKAPCLQPLQTLETRQTLDSKLPEELPTPAFERCRRRPGRSKVGGLRSADHCRIGLTSLVSLQSVETFILRRLMVVVCWCQDHSNTDYNDCVQPRCRHTRLRASSSSTINSKRGQYLC